MEVRKLYQSGRMLLRVATCAPATRPTTRAPSSPSPRRHLSTTTSRSAPAPFKSPLFKDYLSSKTPSPRPTTLASSTTKPTSPTKPIDPRRINPLLDDPIQPGDDLMSLLSRKRTAAEDLAQRGMPRPEELKLRLRPSTGKTIYVQRELTPASAMKQLDALVTRNGLRRMMYAQRQHERPGLKRKRLAKERYAYRAKSSFKASCKRVRELAAMGW